MDDCIFEPPEAKPTSELIAEADALRYDMRKILVDELVLKDSVDEMMAYIEYVIKLEALIAWRAGQMLGRVG